MRPVHIRAEAESTLANALALAAKGQGSAWIVAGPAGIGKSTLLSRVAARAKHYSRLRVVRTTCTRPIVPLPEGTEATDRSFLQVPTHREAPSDSAYGVVARLLSQLDADVLASRRRGTGPVYSQVAALKMDPARIARAGLQPLGRLALDALLAIASSAATLLEGVLDIAGVSDEADFDSRRFINIFSVGLQDATRRPCLILVDDAQFMDPQSSEVIFTLVRNLADRPCMIVLAAEDDEMHALAQSELWHPLETAVGSAIAQGALSEIRPAPWSRETIVAFLAKQYSGLEHDAALVDLLALRTGGLPLFVTGLLAHLQETQRTQEVAGQWHLVGPIDNESLPRRIEEVLRSQLQRVDAETREAIERASVEGAHFHYAVVRALTAPTSDEALRAHLRAAEHYYGLIRTVVARDVAPLGGVFAFSRALIRDYAYGQIPRETQRLLHGIVADVLSSAAAETPGAFARDIVLHAGLAGRADLVLEHSGFVCKQALDARDWRTALSFAEAALRGSAPAAPESPAILELRRIEGESLYRLQRWDQAIGVLEEVFHEARGTGAFADSAHAMCLLSRIENIRGQGGRALTLAKDALRLATSAGAPALQLAALECIHRGLQSTWPITDRFAVYNEIILPELLRLLGDASSSGQAALEARVRRWLARVFRTLGDDGLSREHLAAALDLAWATRQYELIVALHYLKIDFASQGPDTAPMLAAYRDALSVARRIGDPTPLSNLLCNYGSRLKELRQYGDAQTALQEALALGEDIGSAELLCMAEGNLASLDEAKAAWPTARIHHLAHLKLAERVGNVGGVLAARLGLARVALAEGRSQESLRALQQIPWPTNGMAPERVEASLLEARVFLKLTRLREAEQAVNVAVRLAEEGRDNYWIATALLARAEFVLDGLDSRTAAEDISRATAGFRALTEQWVTSLPLRVALQHAEETRRTLAARGYLPAP